MSERGIIPVVVVVDVVWGGIGDGDTTTAQGPPEYLPENVAATYEY